MVLAVVGFGVVVHPLRVLLEANNQETIVVACSRCFCAIKMPDATIMRVLTLHSNGVCKLPLERRGDGKGKEFHHTG